MNRFRLFAIGTVLMVASTAFAQQAAKQPASGDKDKQGQHVSNGDAPTAEQQLKVLTGKLGLISNQQARVKPILQELHVVTEKLVQDKSLSREERMDKATPHWYKADRQIREILSEDQKKKLDQYEQGPHPEMHGDLGEETASHP